MLVVPVAHLFTPSCTARSGRRYARVTGVRREGLTLTEVQSVCTPLTTRAVGRVIVQGLQFVLDQTQGL